MFVYCCEVFVESIFLIRAVVKLAPGNTLSKGSKKIIFKDWYFVSLKKMFDLKKIQRFENRWQSWLGFSKKIRRKPMKNSLIFSLPYRISTLVFPIPFGNSVIFVILLWNSMLLHSTLWQFCYPQSKTPLSLEFPNFEI